MSQRRDSRLPRLPWCLALPGLLLWGGCAGYQIGTPSLYPDQVRTVYVPMFQSDSYRRNLGERLTEAVMKEIEAKSTFKVVSNPNADSVLIGRITSETKRVAVENRFDDPRELDIDLQVEVRWIDRHGGVIREFEPIRYSPEVVGVGGSAPLFPEVGQSVATAQQLAMQRIAEQIVGMMELPW